MLMVSACGGEWLDVLELRVAEVVSAGGGSVWLIELTTYTGSCRSAILRVFL